MAAVLIPVASFGHRAWFFGPEAEGDSRSGLRREREALWSL